MLTKILLLATLANPGFAAKILALMVVPSHSHHLWNSKYLEALADEGHEITYFTVDEYENPPKNVRTVLVEGMYEEIYGHLNLVEMGKMGPYEITSLFYELVDQESRFLVRSEGFERLKRILRNEKFDLVVHDSGTCFFLLGAVDVLGKVPVVGITAFGVPVWSDEILGNPTSYSSKPFFYTSYSDEMNFFQRANNFFLHLYSSVLWHRHLKEQNEYSKKAFGDDVRPLDRIIDDLNILMVNDNHGLDYEFPRVSGLVSVGGLHIADPKPLPQDLQRFLDDSESGVVYFSLGSNLKSVALGNETVKIFLEAFERLSPIRVLWKWESDFLPGKPENVKIGKWLPQSDILGHPNVRLFFTHGGMLSTQESIDRGKPMVGMPFFLDQSVNVAKLVAKGLGERLEIDSLSPDKVVETIEKVLGDPRYSENARKSSVVFRDQITNPARRAVYWTEYAIRNRGAPHLRHSARNLSWYQNRMLDVLFVALFASALLLYLFFEVSTRFLAAIFRKKSSHSKSKQN